MTNFVNRYQTDKTLEENGQWVNLGDGIEVKIARLNSERSQAVRRRLEKPYSKMRGEIPTQIQEEILTKQVAEAVLLDWKGVELESGKPLEPTLENKIKILTEFKDFRQDVVFVSMEAETFKNASVEEATKN